MSIIFEKPKISIFDISAFNDTEFYEKVYRNVSNERKEKVNFFFFSKSKYLSLATGFLLERELKNLGIKDYSLNYGEFDKPYLVGIDNLYFNLSHSGQYAICAFYNSEIGIDIEQIVNISEPLIREVTTLSEYNFLINLDKTAQKENFFRLWTAKESYMKYTGKGLSISPKKLEINFASPLTIKYDGSIVPVLFQEYIVT